MILHPTQFSDYFGGTWPMFQGQGELTYEEFTRKDTKLGCIDVTFEIEGPPLHGWMHRHFDTKQELLDYMRRWGLGATDIDTIYDRTPRFVTKWCVLAYDPFYGSAFSKEGYRRRWYFDTEEEADHFADYGLPKGMVLAEVYQVERRTF